MATTLGSDDDDSKKELDDGNDLIQSDKETPQYQTPQYPTPSYSTHAENSIESDRIIGYGILGCAGIASKIARAIHLEPNSQITVVASRSLEKAQNFVARNCPNAEALTYDELIQSDAVDIIYIPIPTALRLAWIVKAIEKVRTAIMRFLPLCITHLLYRKSTFCVKSQWALQNIWK